MTLIMPVFVRCAVCGKESGQAYLKSSNGTGNFDLDFRPHGMIHDTIYVWISRCPHCGYCAANVGRQLKLTKRFVISDDYQQQLIDTQFPEKANEFMCASMLYEHSGSYAKAVHYSLCAAWICDDENLIERSIQLRGKIIDLIYEGARRNQLLQCCPQGGEDILLIDLLRRSGKFDEANKRYDSAINSEISIYPQLKKGMILSENLKSQLIRYEKELVEKMTLHDIHILSSEKSQRYKNKVSSISRNMSANDLT